MQERADAVQAAVNSQDPSCIIKTLDEDCLSYIFHNLHVSPSSGKTSLPSLISACQASKSCKFLSICSKDMKTDIDASRVDRIDDDAAVSGHGDKNLHKSRFILRDLVGGRSITLNAPDGARLIIYRDLDPTSEKRFAVTYALAVPTPHGLVCTAFDLDAAVRIFSGHDTNMGIFHVDDLKIRRSKQLLLPTFEDDEVDTELLAGVYTTDETENDVSNIFLHVSKTANIFLGGDEAAACVAISTSRTSCEPLSNKLYCLKTDSFRSLCDFFGYADVPFVARCRTGPSDDDCHIQFVNTAESLNMPTENASSLGNIDVKNVQPAGKRRRTGARGDLKSYVMVASFDLVTKRGRYKRIAPQWAVIKAEEEEYNRCRAGRGVVYDERIAHDTDSENNDEGLDDDDDEDGSDDPSALVSRAFALALKRVF